MHQALSIWSVKKICHKCFTLTLTGALVLLYIQQQQHHVVINYINSVMICISIRKLILNASSSPSSLRQFCGNKSLPQSASCARRGAEHDREGVSATRLPAFKSRAQRMDLLRGLRKNHPHLSLRFIIQERWIWIQYF